MSLAGVWLVARTLDDIVLDVRSILQDTVTPYRYSSGDVVRAYNNALSQLWRLRADIFFGHYEAGVPSYSESDLGQGEVIPVDDMYATPIIYFMAGFAELRDDEFTVDARAVTLVKQFASDVRGIT